MVVDNIAATSIHPKTTIYGMDYGTTGNFQINSAFADQVAAMSSNGGGMSAADFVMSRASSNGATDVRVANFGSNSSAVVANSSSNTGVMSGDGSYTRYGADTVEDGVQTTHAFGHKGSDIAVEDFTNGFHLGNSPRGVMDPPMNAAETMGRLAGVTADSFVDFAYGMIGGHSADAARANWNAGNYGTAALFETKAFGEAGLALTGIGGVVSSLPAGATMTAVELAAARATYGANSAVANSALVTERGIALFGRDNLSYYVGDINGSTPSLGAQGRPFFMMPIEDSALVPNPVHAAIESGLAPSAERAWKNGGDLFGVSVPLDGISTRLPVQADAMGWRHFLDGGNTAVNVPKTDWFIVNKTREFVIDGGAPMPKGSVVFRVGDQGDSIPLWKY